MLRASEMLLSSYVIEQLAALRGERLNSLADMIASVLPTYEDGNPELVSLRRTLVSDLYDRARNCTVSLTASDCDLSADTLHSAMQSYLQSSSALVSSQLLTDPALALSHARLELVQLELEMGGS